MLLLAVVVLAFSIRNANSSHHHVSTHCAGQNFSGECRSLSYYMDRAVSYFQSPNNTFVFHKGEHLLELKESVIVKVGNLLLQGIDESYSIIHCVNDSGTSIRITGGDIMLSKLTFIGCGADSFPFQFEFLRHLSLEELLYQGMQLKIINVTSVTIRRSKLKPINGGKNFITIFGSDLVSIDDTVAFATQFQIHSTHLNISNSWITQCAIQLAMHTHFSVAIEKSYFFQGAGLNITTLSRDSLRSKNSFPSYISLTDNTFNGRGIISKTSIALDAPLLNVVVTIQKCLFTHNHSLHLSTTSNHASVLLQDSIFTGILDAINLIAHNSNVCIDNCNFYNNHGCAIDASLFNTTISLVNTSVQHTSYVSHQSGAVNLACLSLTTGEEITFQNVLIAGNGQTGIVSNSCSLNFVGCKNVIQENWSPGFGGGISLYGQDAYINVDQYNSLTIAGNVAVFGGGIYFDSTKRCPFRNDDIRAVVFRGNRGLMSGNDFFGLSPELCNNVSEAYELSYECEDTAGSTILRVPNICAKVCFCHNSEVDCSRRVGRYWPYSPYNSVEVAVGVVGPRGELLPADITVNTTSLTTNFVTTEGNCAVVALPYYCSREKESIVLSFYTGMDTGIGMGMRTHLNDLEVILECSNHQEHSLYKRDMPNIVDNFGWQYDNASNTCSCNDQLKKLIPTCTCTYNISNDETVFTKDDTKWVWYNNESSCVYVHYCPHDFCASGSFLLNGLNKSTCSSNREGMLCSSCAAGYSVILGSNECKKCDNSNLMLVVLIGFVCIVIMVLVVVFDINVANGGFNGLIFYANMVKLNEVVFFHPFDAYQVIPITQFVAWINLDMGLTSCFSSGMDIYTRTWLQYTYPGILFLMICVTLVFHYVPWCTENCMKDVMPIVGFLVLLSYTKLLRNAAVALTSYRLTCYTLDDNTGTTYGTNGTNSTYGTNGTMNSSTIMGDYDSDDMESMHMHVWPLDASMPYGNKRHAGLIAVAVITVVICVVFLIFINVSPLLSKLRIFNRRLISFKQFAESYHAPFKPKYRFWIGIELAIRPVLILIFGLVPEDYANNPNTYVLAFVASSMIVAQVLLGRIYKKLYLNLLDLFYLFNLLCLCIVSAAAIHFDNKSLQKCATITSVSLCIVVFVSTSVFNLIMRCKKSQLCQRHNVPLPDIRRRSSEVVRLLSGVVNDNSSSDEDDDEGTSLLHRVNGESNDSEGNHTQTNHHDDTSDDDVEPDSPHPYVKTFSSTPSTPSSLPLKPQSGAAPMNSPFKPPSGASSSHTPRSPRTPLGLKSPRNPQVVIFNLGESQEEKEETHAERPVKQSSIIEQEENV